MPPTACGPGEVPWARRWVVAGVKDRPIHRVEAVVVRTDGPTLRWFVHARIEREARVYTGDAMAYSPVQRARAVVPHSVGVYVRGQAHSNGLESFGALRKRDYMGV